MSRHQNSIYGWNPGLFGKSSDQDIVASIEKDVISDVHMVGESESENNLRHFVANYVSSKLNSSSYTSTPDWITRWYERRKSGEMARSVFKSSDGFLEASPMFGYGCWCFKGPSQLTDSGGKPKDVFDKVCKSYVQCLRCAKLETGCNPVETSFQANPVQYLAGLGKLAGTCRVPSNENKAVYQECKWQTCYCQLSFLKSFLDLVFDPSRNFKDATLHSKGFDWRLECKKDGRSIPSGSLGEYFIENGSADYQDSRVDLDGAVDFRDFGSNDTEEYYREPATVYEKRCCGKYPKIQVYSTERAACCHDVNVFKLSSGLKCCSDGTTSTLCDDAAS